MRPVIRIRNRIQTELPLVFYFIFPVKWTKIRVFQFPILLFNKKKKKKRTSKNRAARGLLDAAHTLSF